MCEQRIPRAHCPRGWLGGALAASMLLPLTACSLALDWRDVRPAEAGITLLMPCRPNVQTRTLQLAGRTVKLSLAACSAGGATWALAYGDIGDPAAVGPALLELQRRAAANVSAAAASQSLPLRVPGATPSANSSRVRISGSLPDGKPVDEVTAVFVHGTWVYQATVLGEQIADEAQQTFFESLRVGP